MEWTLCLSMQISTRERKKVKMNESDKDLPRKGDTPRKMSRRRFIQAGIAAGILTGAGVIAGAVPYFRRMNNRSTGESPAGPSPSASVPGQVEPASQGLFSLGVASGDPLPDGIVLWTRLAPEPLKIGGGMSNESVAVQWEIAEDEKFQTIVKSGTETAEAASAHSVHAEVSGLEPAKLYYYRFKTGSQTSPVGRTKTAPAANAKLDRFQFAFASCQSFQAGYYTAYDHLVKEDIDLVVFLGDYIYTAGPNEKTIKEREHYPKGKIDNVDSYRIRYAQYKADPSLQAAHAAFPWIVTFDDHEVKNNWLGEMVSMNTPSFLKQKAAAFQAYYEHMPFRKASIPNGPSIQIYRRIKFGDLAEFSVLDTRQYRSGVPCANQSSACEERFDPSFEILGKQQEQWLFDGLKASTARWNIIAQQILMAQITRKEADGKLGFNTIIWDGYAATRNRLQKHVSDNKISNLVVLTGDSHNNWVNDLMVDFDDKSSAVWGTEFGVTSISSGGDGGPGEAGFLKAKALNPHIKYNDDFRGYVYCQITPEEWKSYYRAVPYVTRKGAPLKTSATFALKSGKPGVVRI
jgi:alkaline phosphatase D